MRAAVKHLAACLVALALVVSLSPAHAQTSDTGLRLFESSSLSPDPVRQLRRLAPTALDPAATALEGAVDPSVYVVGPGDVFTVTLGAPVSEAFPLTVTPDGVLAFPDVGTVAAAGATLAEVRARSIEALRGAYRNVRADVSLAQPRRFYVHVTGAVGAPGRYPASPVTRVSDVLGLAFTDSSRAVANPGWRPSLRSVTLVRGGARTVLDVQRYLATGATDENPFLHDGDVLTVGAYDGAAGVVYVDGAVPFPGAYPYRPDDTAADLLALATAGAGTDGGVHLTRYLPDGPAETTDVAAPAAVALRPLDHLYVAAPTAGVGAVRIEGAVRLPGTYPVVTGETTLADLLARAGGLRDDALARGAYLERAPLRTDDALHALGGRALAADTAATLFGRTRLADLGFTSRAYLTRELRLGGRGAVDLAEAASIRLRDGDRIVIPRDAAAIRVFGQVARPGDVPYDPSWGVDDYLAAVGGRTALATRVYVVEAGTQRYLPAEDVTELRSGDELFVDRRADVADTAELQRIVYEERRARGERTFRILQTVSATAGFISALATLYIALNR